MTRTAVIAITNLPSLNGIRLRTPETVLVVDEAVLALALLRPHAVATDVELGTVVRMRIGGMGEQVSGGPDDVTGRTAETVVKDVAFQLVADSGSFRGPDAGC